MTRLKQTVTFELQNALAVERNLGVLSGHLAQIQGIAIKGLRRRLVPEAKRDIRAEYNVPAGRLAKDLSAQEFPSSVRLKGRFKGIGLINFAARQTLKGVTYSIFRGKRGLLDGAFIATLPGGNVQVMERFGAKRIMTRGRYVGKLRQPIHTQYGPTAAQMLRKGRRPERLVDYAVGFLGAEVRRLLKLTEQGSEPIPDTTLVQDNDA
jgi:hypothetical protein